MKRGRPPADLAEHLQGPTSAPGKRRRVDAFRVASLACKEVVTEHAQWWNSDLKPQVDASRSSAVAGVEAAFSARVADECVRVSGENQSEEEEKTHADIVF